MEDIKDKNLSPKSFRITDETANKIKEISAEIGGNQQETIAKLIEAYEFQAGKAVHADKKADIEKFEQYINILTRMYMSSLEDNQSLSDTIRTEFDALLKSKDATIQDLQGRLALAKQIRDEATAQSNGLLSENANLKEIMQQLKDDCSEKITDLQSMVTDKDSVIAEKEKVNRTLTELWMDTKSRLTDALAELEDTGKIKEELANLQTALKKEQENRAKTEDARKGLSAELEDTRRKYEDHEKEIITKCNKAAADDKERALFELERKHQQQIQSIIDEKQKEIDKYQQKYMDLLEKISKEKTKNI